MTLPEEWSSFKYEGVGMSFIKLIQLIFIILYDTCHLSTFLTCDKWQNIPQVKLITFFAKSKIVLRCCEHDWESLYCFKSRYE